MSHVFCPAANAASHPLPSALPGPPRDFDPVGAEQLTGEEATRIEASRTAGTGVTDKTAAAQGGAGDHGTPAAAAMSVYGTAGSAGAPAAAPAGSEDMSGTVSSKVQVGDHGDQCLQVCNQHMAAACAASVLSTGCGHTVWFERQQVVTTINPPPGWR